MNNNKLNLLGFNMWNNRGRFIGQTSIDYGLGRMRNTVGSTSRIYKHCSKYSANPLGCALGVWSKGEGATMSPLTPPITDVLPIPIPIPTDPTAPNPTVPDPPTILTATAGNGTIVIYFTSGSDIIEYLYSINGGTFVSTGSLSSPITIFGLASGTTYTVNLKAVNRNGPSMSSNSVSVTTLSNQGPLAPVLTGVVSKTLDSMVLTFTQESNGFTITNYKYSIDGGKTFVAFSPVDISSPVTISNLTSNTRYRIVLKAVSSIGDSPNSNLLTETTYANVNYAVFSDVGSATWTAPNNVTFVEYLIVGGGGGGGGTYSKINVLGNVPVTSTPQPGAYWINSANLTNGRYSGRLYYGYNTYQNSSSFSDPVRLTASENFTPSGVFYAYQKWYNFEMVYMLNGALPISTNVTYIMPQGMPSPTYSNNISAGSGGGGGGHIQTSAINPQTKYTVVPGTTYNIYVGAGGRGGASSTNVENPGSAGESSYFDTIIAAGGAGGYTSRTGANQNGGGGYYSGNLMGGRGGAGGGRNGGSVINSEAYQWNSTVLRGTYGGSGASINFDGTGAKTYGAGGDGGASNTIATTITPDNIGKGGSGTGAELNSYANGMDGGSGIVIIKYYT
jgi:hypothetical protein